MKYISVCSGIEAVAVAWVPLGWKPLLYSEIDKFPSAVLAHRHPGSPNLGDMTNFKEWGDYETDVLVGGTPCQSFSVAGLRKGLDDPRGNLMLTYLAITDRYRPRWLVWENVPGVLSSNKGRDFGTFLGSLEQLGYGFAYRILDAQYFGVPQRRRRVFVVGYLGDWRRAAAVLFERHSLCWNPPPSREKGQKVAEDAAIGIDEECNATVDGFGPLLRGGQGGTRQAVAYSSTGAGYWKKGCGALRGRSQDSHENLIAAHDPASTLQTTSNDYSRADNFNFVVHGTQDPCISGKAFPIGRNNGGENVLAFHQNVRSEVRETEIPGALTSGGGKPGQGYPAIRNGMQVRRLTPIECERLQGFPDNYTQIPWRNKPAEDCPNGPRYKALGNSMAVPVMKWIGERIEEVESNLS